MSIALLTINFNAALCDNARASMQAGARRWGAEYWEVNEASGWRQPTAPNAYKCAAFERSEYGPLIAVANGNARFGDLWQVKSAEANEVRMLAAADPRFAGLPYDPATYFNTGMMLARRRAHAEMFALALEVCHSDHGLGWIDQTPLNRAAVKLGVPVKLVDERWNYIHGRTLGDGWLDMPDVYIMHFAGEPGRELTMPKVKWE